MKKEIGSMNDEKVWKLVYLPNDRKKIPVRWTYDVKLNINKEIICFKARLASKDFTQIKGARFSEIFSPDFEYATVRPIFALIAKKKLEQNVSGYQNGFFKRFTESIDLR